MSGVVPQIVCWPNILRYYGANPQLLQKYREIIDSGKCPFCPENIGQDHKIVGNTESWNIVLNPYPYANPELHLLIIPKRHVINLDELTLEEWSEMARVIAIAVAKSPFPERGHGLAIRVQEIGGVTLYHLHWHFIIPKIDPQKGQIAVNFGIG